MDVSSELLRIADLKEFKKKTTQYLNGRDYTIKKNSQFINHFYNNLLSGVSAIQIDEFEKGTELAIKGLIDVKNHVTSLTINKCTIQDFSVLVDVLSKTKITDVMIYKCTIVHSEKRSKITKKHSLNSLYILVSDMSEIPPQIFDLKINHLTLYIEPKILDELKEQKDYTINQLDIISFYSLNSLKVVKLLDAFNPKNLNIEVGRFSVATPLRDSLEIYNFDKHANLENIHLTVDGDQNYYNKEFKDRKIFNKIIEHIVLKLFWQFD